MQKLEDSLKFRQWKDQLDRHGIVLHSHEELHTVRKGKGDVLFSLLKIKAEAPEGNPILPIVMLRGAFVTVLTALIDAESGEEFHLLVRQRRVANGALFYEHPAGMADGMADPFEVALLEVEEETGMKITREQLTLLVPEPIYSSPGLLDEGGWFFCCTVTMPRTEIDALHLQPHGAGGEGEFIHTYVARPEEVPALIRNASGLLLHFLYQDWKSKQP
jgi:8-oxo-dGTP pyrophosphatase MutT (NUDIX family)